MSYKDILFPDCVALGASGGPGFLTNIVIVNSGQEFPDQVWQLEKGQWEVAHAAKRPEEYIPLGAFFRIARGRANTFRFLDHTDFEVSIDQGVFLELTPTTFQMEKRYSFDSEYYDRKITKPRPTPEIDGGSVASIDYSTGIVTMTSGTPTAWSGIFHCHCRFDTDKMVRVAVTRTPDGDLLITWASVLLVEIK